MREVRMSTKCLGADDFASTFDMEARFLPKPCLQTIAESDFRYEETAGAERDRCLLEALKILENGGLSVSGPERLPQWEEGWKENLEEFSKSNFDFNRLKPKYYRHRYLRYRRNYIKPASIEFENSYYTVVRQMLFSKYLSEAPCIIDFGCGTGTSLLILSDLFPEKELIGCDWASSSQSIVAMIAQKTGRKMTAANFDMFSPRRDVLFPPGSAAITMASMEQLNTKYENFLNYLMAHKPSICLHLEPLIELYDKDDLFDHLAFQYHRKRGYLNGFLTSLRNLETEGKISILDVRRLFFGSMFHEGYSIVIWRPTGAGKK
jgi:SAM-dependent methyltransferase